MQIGVLFSGQGAQKPGMGVDFLGDPLLSIGRRSESSHRSQYRHPDEG